MESKPWCTCAFNKQDGYRRDPITNEWVHYVCGKVSRLIFMKKLSRMTQSELLEHMKKNEN